MTMSLEIIPFTLGPAMTNAYLVADPASGDAAVIDPSWDGELILKEAVDRKWRIAHLWYTHAHFDHIGGAAAIADALNPLPLVALHPADHILWKAEGGARMFGLRIDPGPEPAIDFHHGQVLQLGQYQFEVRHTPGHTPGHVILYCQAAGVLFSGDLIFQASVGRTDLPGGDTHQLVDSIRAHVFSLPDETRILSGHGPDTTVAHEKRYNPFVNWL